MATKKKASKAAPVKKSAAPKASAKKAIAKTVAPKKSVVLKAAPKKKAAIKIPTADKSSALQKIAVLQAQMTELKNEVAQELKEKLAAARVAVRDLETELTSLTGGFGGRRGRG